MYIIENKSARKVIGLWGAATQRLQRAVARLAPHRPFAPFAPHSRLQDSSHTAFRFRLTWGACGSNEEGATGTPWR